MNNTVFDRTKVIKYLIWTFGLAYAIQIGVWLLYKNGLSLIGSLVMAAMMFVPMLGVLLSGSKLSGMGWNPRIKKEHQAYTDRVVRARCPDSRRSGAVFSDFSDSFRHERKLFSRRRG